MKKTYTVYFEFNQDGMLAFYQETFTSLKKAKDYQKEYMKTTKQFVGVSYIK